MKNCSNFMIYIELLQPIGGADGRDPGRDRPVF